MLRWVFDRDAQSDIDLSLDKEDLIMMTVCYSMILQTQLTEMW